MHPIVTQDCERILNSISVQDLAGRTLLLTGSCGFLGCYFMHTLLQANRTLLAGQECKLLALDNFFRGRPSWLELFEADSHVKILDRDIVQPVGDLPQVDYIIHAASIASPIFYRKHPLETMDANVQGLRNLLDFAVEKPPRSFLFFSTSEIYGDPDPANIPTSEDYRGNVSCTGPRACYDESKRYGETLCVVYRQVHQVPIKVVRPFNNYGPGLSLHDQRVIPDFCRNLLDGQDVVLLSDGSPSRTFCYVSDAVTGYWKALLSSHDGEPFNIGSERPEITMKELAELIARLGKEELGISIGVTSGKSPDEYYLKDNPNRRCPNIDKAKRMLDYQPQVGLEEGLRRSIRWYHDQAKASV